jgi:peptide/nickel transport system permease protein
MATTATAATGSRLQTIWPVLRFLALRLLGAVAILLLGAAVVFLTMKAAPGDPALTALGESASPEVVAAFRARYALDAPLPVQFWLWLSGILRGDFGTSLVVAAGRPIGELILQRLPATVFVGLLALTMAIVIAFVLGTIAALQRGKTADMVATSVAVLGISMPDFWLSYVLIFGLSLSLGLFPAYGFVPPSQSFLGALHASFLPALAIAAPMAAVFARTLRAALLEVMRRPYVMAARSYGFSGRFVFLHFILRNALIPFITVVGLQVRYLLGGVVVIERIFGVPGIGSLMVDAAFGRDYPLVQACAVTFLAIVLSVNLLVDLICTLLDPRRSR